MSALLSVGDLRVAFGADAVVEGVGFELARGEALGIVGESGSGKSMTCRAVLGLLPPAARVSGSVRLDGAELLAPGGEAMAAARGRRMAMIFQAPASHLDPLMRIGDQVAEALIRHRGLPRAEARRRAAALLGDMRIPDPARWARAYPHEVPGGMKQRAMIAGALACDPDVLLADEPTTALDVTVQGEILALLARLGRERGLAVVLVSHDLGAVAQVCDRVLVMRAGRIVEHGPTARVVGAPRQPYTRVLVDAHSTRLGRAARAPSPAATPRIEARGITVRYGGRGLVDLLRNRPGASTRCGTRASPSAPAKRWASWARAAWARARSPAPWWDSCAPPPARSATTAVPCGPTGPGAPTTCTACSSSTSTRARR